MATTESDRERVTNGHADPLADADTIKLDGPPLPWPSQRRTLGERWRSMTGRPVRERPGEAAERRPVPTWVPNVIVTIGIVLLTQAGLLIYWKGQLDRSTVEYDKAVVKVQDLTEANRELKGRVEGMENLEEWVGLLVVYEQGLREELKPITDRYGIKMPPMPARPPRRKP